MPSRTHQTALQAICSQLCKSIPAPFSLPAPRSAKTSRWALILADYVGIREAVLNSPRLMAQTNLQPFELNQRPVVRLMDGL